jgi:alpha-mannosidase
VHVDRALVVEERVTRELYERVLPLVHRETGAAHDHGRAEPDDQRRSPRDRPWGPPWGTTWFTFTGEVPDHWSGGRVEAVIDLGFHPDAAGFQCEGSWSTRPAGRCRASTHAARTSLDDAVFRAR